MRGRWPEEPTLAEVIAATEPSREQVAAALDRAQLELPYEVEPLEVIGVLDVLEPGPSVTKATPRWRRKASA